MALIRACQDCQVHRPIPRNSQQKLTPITSLWPFYKWGIDIAGPFSKDPGKVKFLIVAVDYFTKWIEAKLVATIAGNQTEAYDMESSQGWTHAQDRIEESAHGPSGTSNNDQISNEDTPFSLTYGTKAVIPAEICMPTLRTAEVDMVQNDEALEINLDHLEERREQAAILDPKSKAKMEKYYNSKVRSTSFKPGDLVYHSNDASHTEEVGKLGPKREGPYEVTEALGKGAYKLRDYDGSNFPRT
ncbi:reverse transcriptase domain-containing protein [Tanacetum coccineum]|uniref:Reverse transcriptase domain-containing protein n=1 Tax=Tanacetum coccineum TaxID=301880 RepID=A0ABQ5EWJ4_9ASTR